MKAKQRGEQVYGVWCANAVTIRELQVCSEWRHSVPSDDLTHQPSCRTVHVIRQNVSNELRVYKERHTQVRTNKVDRISFSQLVLQAFLKAVIATNTQLIQ